MATIYITEYTELGWVGAFGNKLAMMPVEPAVADQNVAIGSSSAASAAFNAATKFIRVNTDSACSIAIGATPVAVATAHRLAANETDYYVVTPGQKLAVITNT